jgi:hypothetical protein
MHTLNLYQKQHDVDDVITNRAVKTSSKETIKLMKSQLILKFARSNCTIITNCLRHIQAPLRSLPPPPLSSGLILIIYYWDIRNVYLS